MSKNQLPPKQPNTLIRYSNFAVQMGVIIGLSSWGGVKLDAYFKTQQPYYTIVLSLLGIGIAFYIVIKGLISDSKKEDENTLFKPVLISIIVSSIISLTLNFIFPLSNQNNHWLYSLAFFSLLTLILNVLYIQKTDGKGFVNIIMVASISRFLVSGIAFFVYAMLCPSFKIYIIIHFMIHYFVFTCFEILFLLKIVNAKSKTNEPF